MTDTEHARMLTSRITDDAAWPDMVRSYLSIRIGKRLAMSNIVRRLDGSPATAEPLNLEFAGFDGQGRALFAVPLEEIDSLDDQPY